MNSYASTSGSNPQTVSNQAVKSQPRQVEVTAATVEQTNTHISKYCLDDIAQPTQTGSCALKKYAGG